MLLVYQLNGLRRLNSPLSTLRSYSFHKCRIGARPVLITISGFGHDWVHLMRSSNANLNQLKRLGRSFAVDCNLEPASRDLYMRQVHTLPK